MAKSNQTARIDERVGRHLKALRLEHGLEQRDVAARLEVLGHSKSATTISNWERGKTSVNLHDLEALAQVYRVTLGTLSSRLGLCGDGSEASGRTLELQDLLNQAGNLPPDRVSTLLGFVRTTLLMLESGDPNRTN